MSVFDVRGNEIGAITEIVFAEEDWNAPYRIIKGSTDGIALKNEDGDEIYFNSKTSLNLMKALEKCIEVGWIKVTKPVVKKVVAAKPKLPVKGKLPVKAAVKK